MTTLTTDIFTDDRFSLLPFGVTAAVLFLIGLVVATVLDRNRNMSYKEERNFAILILLMMALGVGFLVMFIVDTVQMHNLEVDRTEAFKLELIDEGYNNIINMELQSYHSAHGAEFTYIEGNTPVDCAVIGDESKVIYKVACFD